MNHGPFEALTVAVHKTFPHAILDTDADGEVVIYTGILLHPSGELIDPRTVKVESKPFPGLHLAE